MKKLFIPTLALLITINVASAAPVKKEFKVLKKTVSFELAPEWQSVNKDVGVPLKLMGPMHEGSRAVITLVPIDLKGEKIILDNTKEAEESYKLSRLGWLQTFNGKSISFLPLLTYTTNNKKIEVTQFGHLYTMNNESFEEKSYYIRCKNETYHLKTLIQVEHVEKWNTEVKQVVDSFRCE